MPRTGQVMSFGVLLAALSACVPFVISNATHSSAYPNPSGKGQPTAKLVAVSNIGNGGWGGCADPKFAKEDLYLQDLLTAEVSRSKYLDLKAQPDPPDIRLEACLRDTGDASKMEGVGLFAALTLWLVPEWYSRDIVLEVRASSKSGKSEYYLEKDSYTGVLWLPLVPFGFYWSLSRGFNETGRRQFQRVLLKMDRDGFFPAVAKAE